MEDTPLIPRVPAFRSPLTFGTMDAASVTEDEQFVQTMLQRGVSAIPKGQSKEHEQQ